MCPLEWAHAHSTAGASTSFRPASLHQARQVAESFGADAERYDRARPRYPDALVERIVAASPGPDVLDVGCGTGIAARQFQAAGCRCSGSTPTRGWPSSRGGPGSRSRWRRSRPGTRPAATFDAVVAGQAWHWVDPVAGAAKAAQVLRPGGRLAVFWHVFEPRPPWPKPSPRSYRRVAPDSPFNARRPGQRRALDVYQVMFTKAADGIRAGGRVQRTGAVAVRLGTVLHPGRVAGPAAHHRPPHPAPAGQAGRGARWRRGRHRHDRGQLHDAVHHAGGHCGANQCHMTPT